LVRADLEALYRDGFVFFFRHFLATFAPLCDEPILTRFLASGLGW